MREGHASRTAEQNALFRALESSLSERRRLFTDPLAQRFLTWPFTLVARLALVPAVRELVPWLIDTRWPGVRTSVVARTRLIDETIATALAEPIEQVVILGAGFDSRAYRLPSMRGIVVFEVDHPDTQAIKRQALARARSAPPQHVRFVAIDFNRQSLDSVMPAAGYRESTRTFILWEGVTSYLTEAAVDTTLRWCGAPVRFSREGRRAADVRARAERGSGVPGQARAGVGERRRRRRVPPALLQERGAEDAWARVLSRRARPGREAGRVAYILASMSSPH
jgi:methyltransferase (TIGR00027 family)